MMVALNGESPSIQLSVEGSNLGILARPADFERKCVVCNKKHGFDNMSAQYMNIV